MNNLRSRNSARLIEFTPLAYEAVKIEMGGMRTTDTDKPCILSRVHRLMKALTEIPQISSTSGYSSVKTTTTKRRAKVSRPRTLEYVVLDKLHRQLAKVQAQPARLVRRMA